MRNPRRVRLVVTLLTSRQVKQTEFTVGEQSEVLSDFKCVINAGCEVHQKFQSLRMLEIFLP